MEEADFVKEFSTVTEEYSPALALQRTETVNGNEDEEEIGFEHDKTNFELGDLNQNVFFVVGSINEEGNASK